MSLEILPENVEPAVPLQESEKKEKETEREEQ